MNTDTTDMLSAELDWRKLDTQFETIFPEYTDTIIIVLEGKTPDQANDAALVLQKTLANNTSVFKSVYYPKGHKYFQKNAFLFLSEDELYNLSDNLSESQAFLSQLINSPNIAGLLTLVKQTIDNNVITELETILPILTASIPASDDKDSDVVSWQNLLSVSNKETGSYKEFIITRPKLDYSNLYPAETGINTIEAAINQLDLNNRFQVSTKLTGTAMLEHEELKSVSETNIIAIIISIVFVMGILILSLDAKQLVIASILTLISGLILTTAYATLIIGELNLISIAFAVLYIGLGIDFAIHYCFSFRDEFKQTEVLQALNNSNQHISKALIICAITTSIGFFSFVPTDYTGVAELGIIAGSGMFISLILTLTFLPSLLLLFGVEKKTHYRRIRPWFLNIGVKHYKTSLLITVIICVLCFLQLDKIKFDNNILNLQDPTVESVITFKELLSDKSISAWTTVVMAKSEEEAISTKEKMQALDVVDKAIILNDLIPSEQDEKLYIIDDMNLLMGDLSLPDNNSIDYAFQQQEINSFINSVTDSDIKQSEKLQTFIAELSVWAKNSELNQSAIEKLQYNWFTNFAGRIQQLELALQTEATAAEDIPEDIKQRWQKDDIWLVEIFPKDNLVNNAAQGEFVKRIRELDARVIGPPVVNIEAGNAVRDAFKRAFTYAFIAVSILLLVLLRSFRDTFCIIFTLFIASLLTITLLPLINIPLNFANIIGLPLLFGIGVDSGIHICNRFHQLNQSAEELLQSSIGQAILISGLTTIFSISNLAFASHAGTASMGLLLSAGILLTLVLMLSVLPAMLLLVYRKAS